MRECEGSERVTMAGKAWEGHGERGRILGSEGDI